MELASDELTFNFAGPSVWECNVTISWDSLLGRMVEQGAVVGTRWVGS